MLKRLFHWVCDDCGTEVIKPEFGKPISWEIIRPQIKEPLKHLCESCKHKYDSKKFIGKDGK